MPIPQHVTVIAEWCAAGVELLGIAILTLAAVYGLIASVAKLCGRTDPIAGIHSVRQGLARGILLGLEFLVAADIIHTVAVELTFTTVGVLAIIVAIRTFLSFSLEVELTGRWPWQQRHPESGQP